MRKLLAGVATAIALLLAFSVGAQEFPVSIETSRIRVCWESTPGTLYQAQYLASGSSDWVSLGEPVRAAVNRTCVEDDYVTPERSYRVILPPTPTGPDPAVMAWIPPGTFIMGSPDNEPARSTTEGPRTIVTISQGFWMDRYEVTQAQYLSVVGTNPSNNVGMNNPVERVTWHDATNYAVLLTDRERAAGRLPEGYVYRLPTEAEWEYAARAGTTTAFHYGNELRSGMANFDGRLEYPPCPPDPNGCANPNGIYLGRTTAVGQYQPNAWGLYDVHGNVYEWVADWYRSNWYPGGSVTDPKGPTAPQYGRGIRGGRFYYYSHNLRSAWRGNHSPTAFRIDLGFRVVLARP